MAGAPWVTSEGNGMVGWATQQDYSEAAAAVISSNGHENTIYELSGKLMNQEELVSELGNVLGKDVNVQQVDDTAYAAIMKDAGLPDFILPLQVGIQESIRNGSLEV